MACVRCTHCARYPPFAVTDLSPDHDNEASAAQGARRASIFGYDRAHVLKSETSEATPAGARNRRGTRFDRLAGLGHGALLHAMVGLESSPNQLWSGGVGRSCGALRFSGYRPQRSHDDELRQSVVSRGVSQRRNRLLITGCLGRGAPFHPGCCCALIRKYEWSV